MKEIHAMQILNATPFLGGQGARSLIDAFGSAYAVLQAPLDSLLRVSGIGPKKANALFAAKEDPRILENIAYAEAQKIAVITYNEARFPSCLNEIQSPPLLLYALGDLELLLKESIALVGTRKPTLYGQEKAFAFGSTLAKKGYVIVSGLAQGIDSAAHLGALKEGTTIAVLGSGLAHIYPKSNKALALRIAREGLLLSEYPPLTPPEKAQFLQRNRLVCGLAKATVLIEAPLQGGSLNTLLRARSERRPCFALTGHNDTPSFAGNRHLLEHQFAQACSSCDDLFPLTVP